MLKKLRRNRILGSIVAATTFMPLALSNAVGAHARQQAATTSEQRKQEIGELLTILRDEKLQTEAPEKVINAIRRAGDLKAVEAIDSLIDLLEFAPRFPGESGPGDIAIVEFQMMRYPAVSALFGIGRPALPALVRVIEVDHLSSLKGRNALDAIRNIFRRDYVAGAKYLDEAAQAATNPSSAQDLKDAADELRRLQARFHPQPSSPNK